MKRKALTLLSIGLIFAGTAAAQDAEPIDEIISKGTIQTDPAMSAFRSGDYATAEVEFERNAFCALRATRNFRSGVESARDSSITANVAADAVGTQVSGGQGGVTVTEATPAPAPQFNSSTFKNKDSETSRTCEDRGFQLYMKGLSQLKLGKTAEAKESLEMLPKP